jgi:DNA-directed RNA polymerase specialized sigma24 family protein
VDLSADSCAALFERIRLGDAAAEGELVESFGGRVYAMAVARTSDRRASRDLVQDVLWAVIQALRGGHLRAPDKPAAFVSGTARSLINNYCPTRARGTRDTARSSVSIVIICDSYGVIAFPPPRIVEQPNRIPEAGRLCSPDSN